MLFTGRLGKRVQHHRRGGRLVEEVQRLEEDGYQVLLRGGGKYFWFEHKCKAICLLHKTTQLIKGTLVLSPKAQGPTHGTERRTRRRGRRVIGGFISTHIIPRSINSDHPSPDQLRSKGHLFGLGTLGPVSYYVPRFAGIPSPWSCTMFNSHEPVSCCLCFSSRCILSGGNRHKTKKHREREIRCWTVSFR